MKFSYNWLQEYFKEKPRTRASSVRGMFPEPKKLAELLTLHSFEIESVKKTGNDYILDIDILPNRMPDSSGHLGIAREIAAINSKFKIQNSKLQFKIQNFNKKKNKYLDIKIEDKNLCPRYTALTMRNIKVGESPKWLKERLEVLGLNSINNVVDAANYVMLETGQPLHIFDADKIAVVQISNLKSQISKPQLKNQNLIKQIIVRKAKNGEKIITLDNKEYSLDDSMLVIADSKEPLAIAGVKGGKKAEVDNNTKNIVLESANFNRTSVRNTYKKINLRTDAAIRFSYGIDPNLTLDAIYKLGSLIQELAEGEINDLTDVYSVKSVPATIKLTFDKVRKVLGTNINDKEIINILRRLNIFQVPSPKAGQGRTGAAFFQIPTFRIDLRIEEDLIEEIGRLYGYGKIQAFHPKGELIPPSRNNLLLAVKKAKNFLVGQGFSEVYNYSFIGENDLEAMAGAEPRENILELQNPLTPELKFLRTNLLPNILKAVSLNFKNYARFQLFELGKIFGAFPSFEKRHLGAILADNGIQGKNLFFRMKGVLSSLFETMGISDFWFDDAVETAENDSSLLSLFYPFRLAQVKIGNDIIGFFGEIRSDILTHYDIKKGKIVFFELNFDALSEKFEEETEFLPFSKFPAIIRDISLLVPRETRVIEVEDAIENQGGELLVDTDLFDIYEDEKFLGKKSLALRLVFQSRGRTLSDKEIDQIMEKIIISLEENLEWEVRKGPGEEKPS